jgi:hypothetical protein
MKKVFIILTMSVLTLSFASCSKDDDEKIPQAGETKESYIDASSQTAWNYFSFAENKIVGSAEESDENNATWGARKDWDIAIRRYNIRTNSGAFTTAGASGGVYTLDAATTYASIQQVPANAVFEIDQAITSQGMGGTTTIVRSTAQVIVFKANEDGSLIMPPVYLPAPVYIFRSADGNSFYKVLFTQYLNEASVAGHVTFDHANISK